jgi:hypothetical protein
VTRSSSPGKLDSARFHTRGIDLDRRRSLVVKDKVAVAFPPEGDIRGLRTPAEGMTVARMVMIRCFCVSAFLRFCVSAFLRFCVSASRFCAARS